MRAIPHAPSAPPAGPPVERLEARRLFAAGTGAVYALTNAASANSVAVFDRAADGRLTAAGVVPTGGLGIGDGPDTEGLQSQGALTPGKGNHFLYAVNGGSDTISVFSVGRRGKGLQLVQQIASGGHVPIGVTVHGNLLYVVNYDRLASPAVVGNITGFRVGKHGTLSPLAGSTQPFPAAGTNPGEVAFSPDGRFLAVTQKATDQVLTFAVDSKGRARPPVARTSGGDFPFSLAFGRHGVLVEADDFQDVAGKGAASSYLTSSGGALRLVSTAVPNFQDGTCWVVVGPGGKFAYVDNTNNSVVSAYRIGPGGTLTLRDAGGVTAMTGGVKPRDLALSADGRFLYALNSVSGTVAAFAIGGDGGLTPLGDAGTFPAPGANGLAAL